MKQINAFRMADLVVEPLGPDKLDEVVHFASQHFLSSEPLVVALEWEHERDVKPWFAHHVGNLLSHKLSLGVRDSTRAGRPLVAVCLAAVQHQVGEQDCTILNFVTTAQTPRVRQLPTFLNHLIEDIDFYALYEVSQLVYIDILCVHPEYYGRDLSRRLIRLTEEEACQRGIRLAMTETTGHYSAQIFRRLNYTLHAEIKYSDYKDAEGNVVFQNMGIHQEARAFAKYLTPLPTTL